MHDRTVGRAGGNAACAWLVTLAAAGFTPRVLPAQTEMQAREVTAQPCARCSVRAERVATLAGALDGRPAGVFADSRGRFLILPRFDDAISGDSLIAVFDSSGRYVRKLARRGPGPGELSLPLALESGNDDTSRVYEAPRMTAYAPVLAVARTQRIESPFTGLPEIVHLTSGESISLTRAGRSGTTGRVHLRDRHGLLVRELSLPPSPGIRLERHISASDGRVSAGVWVLDAHVQPGGYSITQLDLTGRVHNRLVRGPSWWFTPPVAGRSSRSQPDTVARPATTVTSFAQASNGLLHVLVAHPAPTWKGMRREDRWTSGYVTRLEVIDPLSGALIGMA